MEEAGLAKMDRPAAQAAVAHPTLAAQDKEHNNQVVAELAGDSRVAAAQVILIITKVIQEHQAAAALVVEAAMELLTAGNKVAITEALEALVEHVLYLDKLFITQVVVADLSMAQVFMPGESADLAVVAEVLEIQVFQIVCQVTHIQTAQ